jgi:glycosyltransferase involved in cell wall biosynthesis
LNARSDRRPLLRLLARILAMAADRLVVLSHSQAEAVGGAALGALVIPNAVVVCDPVRHLPPLRDGRPLRLLFLARMIPQKGVLLCLDALQLLRRRGVHAVLTLAGDGPLLPELPRLVKALGLADIVEVAGPVPPGQVRPLLAAHDLLWAPSTYAEGQPYALIEALEAGVPVIACVPNDPMREFVDGSGGAVVPVAPTAGALAAAAQSLASTPGSMQRLQAAARQVAQTRYSFEASVPLWRRAWSTEPARRAQSGWPSSLLRRHSSHRAQER